MQQKTDQLKQQTAYYKRIWDQPQTRQAIRVGFYELGEIIRHVLPRKLEVFGIVGTGDPASTGQIMAIQGMLYPWHKGNIRLEPDFEDNNITSVMEALVKGAESVFTTKTVVGEATKIDDTIIIPLVDVSFGIGAGASCGAGKDSRKNGGMGGMSGKMSPSAVLLIKNGQTRLVNIKNQDSVSKVIDMIPDLVDRFTTPKQEMMSDEEAVDAAFPEEDGNEA